MGKEGNKTKSRTLGLDYTVHRQKPKPKSPLEAHLSQKKCIKCHHKTKASPLYELAQITAEPQQDRLGVASYDLLNHDFANLS